MHWGASAQLEHADAPLICLTSSLIFASSCLISAALAIVVVVVVVVRQEVIAVALVAMAALGVLNCWKLIGARGQNPGSKALVDLCDKIRIPEENNRIRYDSYNCYVVCGIV